MQDLDIIEETDDEVAVKPAVGLRRPSPNVVVADDIYTDPHLVRRFALQQSFHPNIASHKGLRTRERFLFPFFKECFQDLLRIKITAWEEHGYNGVFQVCTAVDPVVFHSDHQQWAGAIYLTPDAPPEAGTSLWQSEKLGGRTVEESTALVERNGVAVPPGYVEKQMYDGKLLKRDAWRLVDQVGNRFNRLVLWNAQLVHSASCYFGHNLEDGRLIQLFFFDGK